MPENTQPQQPDVPQLLELLHSPDPAARGKAAEELGCWGVWEALFPLLPLLADTDDEARNCATFAVGQIAGTLWEIPSDYHPDSQAFLEEAHQAINAIVIPKFIELMSDPYADVRFEAVDGLRDLKRGGIVVAPLIAHLSDPDSKVRAAVVQSLSLVNSAQITSSLLPLLTDSDLAVKLATIKALGSTKNKKVVSALLPLLADAVNEVREVTISALVRLKSQKAVPYLLPLLSDTNTDIRWVAIDAMGDLGVVEAIPQITRFIFDTNVDIRRTVVMALGKLGGKEALAALIKATSDEDCWVRFYAIESIGQIGDLTNITLLENLIQADLDCESLAQTNLTLGGDYTIREVARKAIKQLKKAHKKQKH
jgi:HEAT repeat protein